RYRRGRYTTLFGSRLRFLRAVSLPRATGVSTPLSSQLTIWSLSIVPHTLGAEFPKVYSAPKVWGTMDNDQIVSWDDKGVLTPVARGKETARRKRNRDPKSVV